LSNIIFLFLILSFFLSLSLSLVSNFRDVKQDLPISKTETPSDNTNDNSMDSDMNIVKKRERFNKDLKEVRIRAILILLKKGVTLNSTYFLTDHTYF